MTDEPNGGTVATGRDEPRPAATDPDHDHTLSIEDVANAYARAGHPRTIRTLQRYCVSGHLDCQRRETTWGDKFMVAPYSVSRHIAQIAEIVAQNPVATGRDEPRPAATEIQGDQDKHKPLEAATGDDKTRQVATEKRQEEGRGETNSPGFDKRYVDALERENSFLRDQIGRKDLQIAEQSERARETNVLIKGLQDLFMRLQPGRPENDRIHEHENPRPPDQPAN